MSKLFSALKMNIFLLLALSFIAGCGTGGLSDPPPSTTPDTSPTAGKGTITFTVVKSSDPTTSTTSISPDSPAIIKATAKDSTGAVLAGKVMSFSSKFDIKFSPASATALTDSNGTAAITIMTGATAGAATITASISDNAGTVITKDTGITVNLLPPPAVPTGVTATAASQSQISLTWTASAGAAGYKIYKGGVLSTAVTATSSTDAGLLASTQYCYAVSAHDVSGNESDKSSQICATTYGPPPAIPADLTVRATLPTQVELSWTASAGASQYKIYRNGVLLPGGAIPAPTTTYVDTSVAANTQYSYAITAIDATGSESSQTAQSTANTGLTVPKDVKATVDSSTQITLSWTNSGGELVKGYKVYKDGNLLGAVSPQTATSIVDSGLTGSTQYCYRVSATDISSNESAKSGTVCGTTQPQPVTPPPAAVISLGTNAVTVNSDNSSEANITATALDASNAVIEGIDIAFSATGGAISASSVKTDAKGQAVIKFSSGTQDQSNQVVTITATASGKSAQIPIQITGSTLTMASLPSVNIPSDGSATAALTITAKNAGGVPVRNVDVKLTVSGAGKVNLSATSGKTDLNGNLATTVTGTAAGVATVKAEGMGTAVTYDYTVTGPAAVVFGIVSPTTDPSQQVTGAPLTVTVSAPTSANVTFAATLGAWDGGTSSVVTKAVAGGTVSAAIQSSLAGFSTVQVYDSAAPATTDSIGVAFYAPAADAAQLSLQSVVSTLGLSTGGISKTTQLKAFVRTSVGTEGQPVGNAPVAFSIANPTGGGESISPVVAYTDATGLAKATFTSGSVSSGAGGVTVNAQVLGSGPPIVTAPSIKIIIGGTAGSVVIGLGSKITVMNPTTYALPMSVLVADSDGSSVPGATVTLSLWPVQYSSGVWYNTLAYDSDNPDKVLYGPYVTGTFDNDDVNENLTKDPTEQSDPYGALRPPNSAGGALPATVTTDANGVANFDLVYLKGSADWIQDRVRATTLALGTETSSSITFTLPGEKKEAENGDLPNALFPVDLTVAVGSSVSYLLPAWISPYTVAPATETYSTTSPYSTITPAPGKAISPVYTFTAPADAVVGKVYQDFITANDGGSTSATAWVRIVVR